MIRLAKYEIKKADNSTELSALVAGTGLEPVTTEIYTLSLHDALPILKNGQMQTVSDNIFRFLTSE